MADVQSEPTAPHRLHKSLKYLAKGKPVVTVEPSAVKAVKDEMKDAFEQVITAASHCHYSVPLEQRESILTDGKWVPTNHIDLYKDARDTTLLKDNLVSHSKYNRIFV
jgi:hypothetical protein